MSNADIALSRLEERMQDEKPHTRKQAAALHVWLRQCSQVAQQHGYTLNQFVHDIETNGMQIPITEKLMKEVYRVAYEATTGHKSTTEASTKDYDPAYHATVLFFGERGMQLPPWPDRRAGPRPEE